MLPTLAMVVGVIVFVAAGNWQRGRMEQKEAMRAQYDAAAAERPIALPAGAPDWAALRYRPVEVRGAYDAGRQILIDNRVRDGRVGYHVVTPLALDDGRAVLVDRGWIAAGATRNELPLAPPPVGPVTVRGRIALPPSGYLEMRREAPNGPVWQNLDPSRFGAATGLRVIDAVVEQAADGAPADGLVRAWPAPDFGIEKHRIYMMQWYLFAALAVGLWGWYSLRAQPGPEARQ